MRVVEVLLMTSISFIALTGLLWYGITMIEPFMNQPYVEDGEYEPTFDDPQRYRNDTEGSKEPVDAPPAAPAGRESEGPGAEPLPVPVKNPVVLEDDGDGKPLVPLPLPVPLPETVEAVNLHGYTQRTIQDGDEQ